MGTVNISILNSKYINILLIFLRYKLMILLVESAGFVELDHAC